MWSSSRLLRNKYSTFGLQLAFLNCWKCDTLLERQCTLICDNCNTVQKPADTKNYFNVMGVQEKFQVNTIELATKFRQMQSILHPDKFVNKSLDEKSISEGYSSLVNEAYRTLKSPLGRALHILKLNNMSIDENDKATDPQFLMEIMDLNEEVDECNSPERLLELNSKNKKILDDVIQDIEKYFNNKQPDKAKDSVIKMKYYYSISQRINSLLRENGITD